MGCVQLSTLVLTDSDSLQHHVTLLYYYERVNQNIYVRQCMALVSQFALYKTWCDVLVSLMGRGKTPLMRLVLHLCEVPVPIPGKMRVIWHSPIFPIPFSLLERDSLPAASFPVTLLFGYLSTANIVQILQLMLLEQKIVFHAHECSLLNAMIEILCDLHFPLKWPYMKVAILPASLLEFLQAPTPYLIGTSTRTLESNLHALPDGVYLIDLNKNTLTHSTAVNKRTTVWFPTRSTAALPPLPSLTLFDQWTQQLSDVMQHLSQAKQKLYQESTTFHYTENAAEIPNTATAAVASIALLSQDFVPQFSMFQYRSIIREISLQCTITLLNNYPAYLQPPTEDTSSLPLFDSKAFMQRFPPEEIQFYERFLSTQMWMKFMEERIYGSSPDREAELLYFEQRMNEKSAVVVAARHHRKKSSSHQPVQVFELPALICSVEEHELQLNQEFMHPLRDFSNLLQEKKVSEMLKQQETGAVVETSRPRASTMPAQSGDQPRYIRKRGRSFRTTHDLSTTNENVPVTVNETTDNTRDNSVPFSTALNAAKELYQTLLCLHFTVTSHFLLMHPQLSLRAAIQSLSHYSPLPVEAYEQLLQVAAQRRDSASAKQLFTLMQQGHVVPSVRACAWMMEAMSARRTKQESLKPLISFDWSQIQFQLEASCIQCLQIYSLDRLLAACLVDESLFTCISCRGLVQATILLDNESLPLWAPAQLLEKWQHHSESLKTIDSWIQQAPDLFWGALLYSVHVLDATPWSRESKETATTNDHETMQVTVQVTQLAQHCHAMPSLAQSTNAFPLSRRLSLDALKKRHAVHRSLADHFTLWINEKDLLAVLKSSLLQLDLVAACKEFLALKQKHRSLLLHVDPYDLFITCPGIRVGSDGEVDFAQRFQQAVSQTGQKLMAPSAWQLAIRQVFQMLRVA